MRFSVPCSSMSCADRYPNLTKYYELSFAHRCCKNTVTKIRKTFLNYPKLSETAQMATSLVLRNISPNSPPRATLARLCELKVCASLQPIASCRRAFNVCLSFRSKSTMVKYIFCTPQGSGSSDSLGQFRIPFPEKTRFSPFSMPAISQAKAATKILF